MSWLSVYPFDVIKARLQATSAADSPYRGLSQSLKPPLAVLPQAQDSHYGRPSHASI